MDDNLSLKEHVIALQIAMESKFVTEIRLMREIFETKIIGYNEKIETKLEAIDRATAIYKDTTDRHLESMNRFREENKEHTRLFYTRELHESYANRMDLSLVKMEERLRHLEASRDKLQGMASQKSVTTAQGIAIGSIILALVGMILHLYK